MKNPSPVFPPIPISRSLNWLVDAPVPCRDKTTVFVGHGLKRGFNSNLHCLLKHFSYLNRLMLAHILMGSSMQFFNALALMLFVGKQSLQLKFVKSECKSDYNQILLSSLRDRQMRSWVFYSLSNNDIKDQKIQVRVEVNEVPMNSKSPSKVITSSIQTLITFSTRCIIYCIA